MIMQGDFGKMVGIKNNEIVRIPLEDVAGKLKMVEPDASIIKEAKAVGISFGD
jgi:6-phosphofructokinase 1